MGAPAPLGGLWDRVWHPFQSGIVHFICFWVPFGMFWAAFILSTPRRLQQTGTQIRKQMKPDSGHPTPPYGSWDLSGLVLGGLRCSVLSIVCFWAALGSIRPNLPRSSNAAIGFRFGLLWTWKVLQDYWDQKRP